MALRRVPLIRAVGGVDDLRGAAAALQRERGTLGTTALARQLIGSLPALGKLLWALARDRRVPRRVRAALVGVAAYLAASIDPIPDFLPVVGGLDDVLLAVVVLRWALRSTDAALIEELWTGRPAPLRVLLELAR